MIPASSTSMSTMSAELPVFSAASIRRRISSISRTSACQSVPITCLDTASSAAIGRRLLVAVALLPAQNDDVGDRVPGIVDADEQEENGGAGDHEEERRRTPRQADGG